MRFVLLYFVFIHLFIYFFIYLFLFLLLSRLLLGMNYSSSLPQHLFLTLLYYLRCTCFILYCFSDHILPAAYFNAKTIFLLPHLSHEFILQYINTIKVPRTNVSLTFLSRLFHFSMKLFLSTHSKSFREIKNDLLEGKSIGVLANLSEYGEVRTYVSTTAFYCQLC